MTYGNSQLSYCTRTDINPLLTIHDVWKFPAKLLHSHWYQPSRNFHLTITISVYCWVIS